ncbi:MAG: hypothetical protein V2J89_16055, partial [Halieaceae bacterium]|nr:hypothetical protein [Halieaceae bacterium]
MDRYMTYALLGLKGALLAWGVMGFIEYFLPGAKFGLQNPGFPPGVQFLHWLLITLTGSIFIGGYSVRWRQTRQVTITLYATLAVLCFVETVDFNAFGGGARRFFIMGAEYTLYIVLAFYLLRSPQLRH